jgi:hypothetical protein
MKHIHRNLLSAICAFTIIAATLHSCKPDDHKHGQENITTLKVKLNKAGGGTSEFTFKSLSGTTTKDEIVLDEGATYAASIQLLDESKTPAKDVTPEIISESNEHQFFYTPTPPSLVTISNLDKDKKGMNFGINSTWVAGTKQSGTLKIVLKHYHGSKSTDPTKGDTDIEVLFNVKVQ